MERTHKDTGYGMRRSVIALFLALILGVCNQTAGSVFAAAPDPASTPVPAAAAPDMASLAEIPVISPDAPRPGVPMRLQIPKINVNAGIEQVATDANGAMDTPKSFANAAWFQPGVRPGELGSAVMDGHVDSFTGSAVFWDLRKLNAGDEIFVLGDDGITRRFLVTGWETYPYDSTPLNRIFSSSTGAHLNLITCDQNSAFDRSVHSYNGALVVYADAAP